jgi:hypothetical protein
MGTGKPELAGKLQRLCPDGRYPTPLQQLGDDHPALGRRAAFASCARRSLPMNTD